MYNSGYKSPEKNEVNGPRSPKKLGHPCLFLYLFIYLSSFADIVHPEDIPGLCWGWTSADHLKKKTKRKKKKIAFLILLSLCPKVHNYYPSIRIPFSVKIWAECPQAWELLCFFLSFTEKGHKGKKPLCIQELLAGYPSGPEDTQTRKNSGSE